MEAIAIVLETYLLDQVLFFASLVLHLQSYLFLRLELLGTFQHVLPLDYFRAFLPL